jgi:hypothetical protein
LQREKATINLHKTFPSFDIKDYLCQHLLRQWSWMCPILFLTHSAKRLPLHMQHVSKGPYCSFMRFAWVWDSLLMFRPHVEEEQQWHRGKSKETKKTSH